MPSWGAPGKDSSDDYGPRLAIFLGMQVIIDREQASVLREILQASLTQLRVESARTDTHDFREALHVRERVVEALLLQLEEAEPNEDFAAL